MSCVYINGESVTVFCNDSFSMCHIATLMYGLGLDLVKRSCLRHC